MCSSINGEMKIKGQVQPIKKYNKNTDVNEYATVFCEETHIRSLHVLIAIK